MYEDLIEQWRIPGDHTRQVNSITVVKNLLANKSSNIKIVMDLGCGKGDSFDLFRQLDPAIKWCGLDIEISPEVEKRTRTDAEFFSFDGSTIPFEDNHFDLIYCNQVLEHVRQPEQLLTDVQRVLKPNGYFIGSVSQLEPYHSQSVWNFTPHGFCLLLNNAGLGLLEIRPSIDALTLIIRSGLGRPGFFSRWWNKESPLNKIISFAGWLTRKSKEEINLAKIILSGQFCFVVQKPGERSTD
jgi:SAM-dependent methyltransferase